MPAFNWTATHSSNQAAQHAPRVSRRIDPVGGTARSRASAKGAAPRRSLDLVALSSRSLSKATADAYAGSTDSEKRRPAGDHGAHRPRGRAREACESASWYTSGVLDRESRGAIHQPCSSGLEMPVRATSRRVPRESFRPPRSFTDSPPTRELEEPCQAMPLNLDAADQARQSIEVLGVQPHEAELVATPFDEAGALRFGPCESPATCSPIAFNDAKRQEGWEEDEWQGSLPSTFSSPALRSSHFDCSSPGLFSRARLSDTLRIAPCFEVHDAQPFGVCSAPVLASSSTLSLDALLPHSHRAQSCSGCGAHRLHVPSAAEFLSSSAASNFFCGATVSPAFERPYRSSPPTPFGVFKPPARANDDLHSHRLIRSCLADENGLAPALGLADDLHNHSSIGLPAATDASHSDGDSAEEGSCGGGTLQSYSVDSRWLDGSRSTPRFTPTQAPPGSERADADARTFSRSTHDELSTSLGSPRIEPPLCPRRAHARPAHAFFRIAPLSPRAAYAGPALEASSDRPSHEELATPTLPAAAAPAQLVAGTCEAHEDKPPHEPPVAQAAAPIARAKEERATPSPSSGVEVGIEQYGSFFEAQHSLDRDGAAPPSASTCNAHSQTARSSGASVATQTDMETRPAKVARQDVSMQTSPQRGFSPLLHSLSGPHLSPLR